MRSMYDTHVPTCPECGGRHYPARNGAGALLICGAARPKPLVSEERPLDFDTFEALIAYEADNLTAEGTVRLFAALVKNGQAWKLQGHYGRTARTMIERGIITKSGELGPNAHTVEGL